MVPWGRHAADGSGLFPVASQRELGLAAAVPVHGQG